MFNNKVITYSGNDSGQDKEVCEYYRAIFDIKTNGGAIGCTHNVWPHVLVFPVPKPDNADQEPGSESGEDIVPAKQGNGGKRVAGKDIGVIRVNHKKTKASATCSASVGSNDKTTADDGVATAPPTAAPMLSPMPATACAKEFEKLYGQANDNHKATTEKMDEHHKETTTKLDDSHKDFKEQLTKEMEAKYHELLKAKDELHKTEMEAKDELHKTAMAGKDELLKAKDELHKTEMASKDELHKTEMASKDELHKTEMEAKDELHKTAMAGKDEQVKVMEDELVATRDEREWLQRNNKTLEKKNEDQRDMLANFNRAREVKVDCIWGGVPEIKEGILKTQHLVTDSRRKLQRSETTIIRTITEQNAELKELIRQLAGAAPDSAHGRAA